MVADDLSKLQSNHIVECCLDEYILEYYVEYIESTFLVGTVNSIKVEIICEADN